MAQKPFTNNEKLSCLCYVGWILTVILLLFFLYGRIGGG